MRKIFTLVLILFSSFVFAQSTPPPQPPIPNKLAADWWSYFQPADAIDADTLTKRAAAFSDKMQSLMRTLSSEGNNSYTDSIQTLMSELDRYIKLKNQDDAMEGAPLVPAAEYDLHQALQLLQQYKQQKLALRPLADDVGWMTGFIAEERKRQSRKRTDYLEMTEDNPQRLAAGLSLMTSRVRLESEALELERRSYAHKAVQSRIARLSAEIETIAEKLVLQPQDISYWQSELNDARQRLKLLGEEAGKAGKSTVDIKNVVQEQHTDLLLMQRTEKDIQRAQLEYSVMHAETVLALLKILDNTAKFDKSAVQPLLQTGVQRNEQVEQQINYWKRTVNRVQAQSAQQLANDEITKNESRQQRALLNLIKAVQTQIQTLQDNVDQNLFVVELIRGRLLTGESTWVRGTRTVFDALSVIWVGGLDLFSATLFELNETPVTTLGLMRVVLILTIAWWISKLIRRAIQHIGEKRKAFSDSALYTLGRMVHYVVLTIGIVIGLSSIGIDLTKFALFASALGVGVGFGLQTLVSNFVAGLIILFEKSLKVGDFVELQSGVVGEVREINMRSTLVTTNDNIDILVPNSEFVNGQVINWTHREAYRRVRVPFGVAYGTDKELVRKAVLEAADKVPWTLKNVVKREPQVWFVQFGDSSLNFELIVWLTKDAVKRPSAVQAAYLWEIETKLREYKIEVPFPQRDLHIRSVLGNKEETELKLLNNPP